MGLCSMVNLLTLHYHHSACIASPVAETPAPAATREGPLPAGRGFQDRIHRLQSPADCRAARYVECSPGGGCGFGCQIHRLATCMAYAISRNATAIVLEGLSRYSYNGCSRWDCVFAETSPCTEWYRSHRSLGTRFRNTETSQRWLPGDLAEVPHAHAWFRGHILAYLMRPSEGLQRDLEGRACSTLYDAGLHVRRGDKINREAQLFHVREYMHQVDRFVHPSRMFHSHYDQRYNVSVFVATDDEGVLVELAGHDYAPYDIHHSRSEAVAQAGRYGAGGHLANLLCEVEHLVHTRFFVGTFSSQVSRLVFELKLGRGVLQPDQAERHVASLDEDYYV